MALGDGFDDCQAKTAAAAVARLLRRRLAAVEAIEDTLPFGGRYPGAIVDHTQHRSWNRAKTPSVPGRI